MECPSLMASCYINHSCGGRGLPKTTREEEKEVVEVGGGGGGG